LPPEYTFVSWLRRGVAAEISDLDTLGTDPDAGERGRATVPVELTLDVVAVPDAPAAPPASITRNVSILGPIDVGGMKEAAMIRTQPAQGALGATPGELPYVEFYEEDFPWRYTPARANQSRLRPWIALFVLTEFEFTLREREGALPVLTLGERAVLPPHTETWAWAHAQLTGSVPANGADKFIHDHPDLALARLTAPRRLLPDTAYHAFIVPAFEAGRLVGLGRDASQTPAQRPAWGTPAHADDRDFPVYHAFSFTTGSTGDFETLARKLTPKEVGDEFGKRPLDVSEPGYGMPGRTGAEVGLEGALAPPDFDASRVAYPDSPGADVADDLAEIVDAADERLAADPGSDDLLIVPPIYGRWHVDAARVAGAAGDLAWLAELNLDPRSRAAAGLGAEVVRQRQDELMQRAWEQVGQVEEANQRLREAELARSAGESVMRKHVAQAGDENRILVLTSAVQAGLSVPASGATQSIRGAVDASRVPAAAQAPAFRRITRPQRPLMRRLTGEATLTGFQEGLLSDMNAEDVAQALSAAPPVPVPSAGVELQAVRDAVADAVQELAAKNERPDRLFLEFLQIELRAFLAQTPPADLDTMDPGDLAEAVRDRADLRYPGATSSAEQLALAERVKTLATAINGLSSDGPAAATVTVAQDAFAAEYGRTIAAKAVAGVTVRGDAPPAGVTAVARAAELSDVQAFALKLGTFDTHIAARTDPGPPGLLEAPSTLAAHLLGELQPSRALGDRLASALPELAGRAASDPNRLAPIMAHPVFPDPMFEPLRGLSQDHIVPNVSDLPRDSLTLMEPNRRFIESYMAGLNHSFAQELLWREYPTDMRGTYFKSFWDTRDALSDPGRDDITAMDGWKGALGAQSALPAGVLVLVVRGELLEKFPSTVVFAQQAKWPESPTGVPLTAEPRVLDPDGEVLHPILHATLEPDITLVGFQLSEEEALGEAPDDAGWFFVLMERPGEPRFGLDDATPEQGLETWNDLAWDAIAFPQETPNLELGANAALSPTGPQPAVWGRTAADMAAILFQAPVLLARHASEMLP
jgi:hypothetical protein